MLPPLRPCTDPRHGTAGSWREVRPGRASAPPPPSSTAAVAAVSRSADQPRQRVAGVGGLGAVDGAPGQRTVARQPGGEAEHRRGRAGEVVGRAAHQVAPELDVAPGVGSRRSRAQAASRDRHVGCRRRAAAGPPRRRRATVRSRGVPQHRRAHPAPGRDRPVSAGPPATRADRASGSASRVRGQLVARAVGDPAVEHRLGGERVRRDVVGHARRPATDRRTAAAGTSGGRRPAARRPPRCPPPGRPGPGAAATRSAGTASSRVEHEHHPGDAVPLGRLAQRRDHSSTSRRARRGAAAGRPGRGRCRRRRR